MRLEKYITDEYTFKTILDDDEKRELFDLLDNNCSQIKKELKKAGRFLFRGYKLSVDPFTIITPRLDRNPKNTNIVLHMRADVLFREIFGWPCRDGVFTASSSSVADNYGHVCFFFPYDGYEYVWSPEVWDFFDTSQRYEKNYGGPGLEILIKTYKDTDIEKAIRSGGMEISFKCDKYVLVNDKYTNDMKKWLRS